MSSRLPYKRKADADRRRRVAERQRNLRRSRSEKIVTNSVAFQGVADGSEVIDSGYVAASQIGDGLGAPFLALPVQPVAASPGTAVTCGAHGFERATTSATFETLFAHVGYQQNLLWRPGFIVRCSDGTTAGEVQAVDLLTGTPLNVFGGAAWLGVVAAGTTIDTALAEPVGGLLLPGVWGAQIRIGIQARRTAGAGSLTVSVTKSIGG